MGNYGIKIAKVGKSITSSDRADYVFWSKYHSRTILISGSTTKAMTDGSSSTLTLTHNLGYIPQVALFVTTSIGLQVNIPFEIYNSTSGYDESVRIVNMSTTAIVLNFNRFNTGSNFTHTVKYLIFMEKII